MGPGRWKLVYLIDWFSLANREFSIGQFISLVRVTPCNFVDSADSFYSTNAMLFRKYYARSDTLCSPSENCTSLMIMTLTSLLIRPIRSIRRTDTFIHDVPSSFHPTISSYYSDGDRLNFRRNKHVCSENKHRGQTQGNVQVNIIPRSLSVSHKVSSSPH